MSWETCPLENSTLSLWSTLNSCVYENTLNSCFCHFTWALLKLLSIVHAWLCLILTSGHSHQHSSLRGQLRRQKGLIINKVINTHTLTHSRVHKHTWPRSSSCFLCSSENLLSQDTLSQATLVFRDRMSFSALVSLWFRPVVRSGLPGMAAIPLLSKPDNRSPVGNVTHVQRKVY